MTRRHVCLCAAFLLFLGFGVPSKAAETVVIGYREFRPLIEITPTGRPTGFVVDVFEEIARREGFRLEWREARSIDALQNGVHVLALYPTHGLNPHNAVISSPWWRVDLALLVHQEQEVEAAAAFRGVVAVHEYATAAAASHHLPTARARMYNTADLAEEAFCSGAADALLLDPPSIQRFLMARPAGCQSAAVDMLSVSGAGTDISLAASPKSAYAGERMRKRIDELALDGSLLEIALKYPGASHGMAVHLPQMSWSFHSRSLLRFGLIAAVIVALAIGGVLAKLRLDAQRRRRTERMLRARNRALEQSMDGVAIFDSAGFMQYTNPAFCKMHQYEPQELIGKPFQTCFQTWADSGLPRPGWLESLVAHGVYEGYLEHERKDGTRFRSVSSAAVMRDSRGFPVGIVAVCHDVTRENALEEQLRQAQKLEAVGRLAGGVAHDFNNLLTVTLGYVEMALLDVDGDSPLRMPLLEIRRASQRAADLTKQLLAFSRKQIMQPKVLGVNALIEDMRKLLRRVIGEDIEVVLQLDPDAGNINADLTHMHQVLLNLCVNARDAMPGGGRLTICTSKVRIEPATEPLEWQGTPAGEYVTITVQDTGHGIGAETLPHIFEPFFTTKDEGRGTGLGLSTVYGIVKQSGGDILVESTLGEGTKFSVLLPRCDQQPEQQKQPLCAAPHRGGRILLVEDQAEVRTTITRSLRSFGFEVLEAVNAIDAIAVCEREEERIGLLLTDVVMPGMSGKELAERVRSVSPHMKILFMSGYAPEPLFGEGGATEQLRFLQKPFSPDELLNTVNEMLGQEPPRTLRATA